LSLPLLSNKFQQVEISKQQVVWHLVDFKLIWKNFAFAVKQKSVGYFDKSIDCFSENLNKKILSGFSVLNDFNNFWFFCCNCFNHFIER